MASEQRKDETLQQYRDRLNREFEEKYPRLAKLSSPEPWDESVDLFLEAVTGEKLERPRDC
ncbi:MAG TPA: hypothetical protein VGH14_03490 [Solirubrobacterales bacterium]|jgi:hypothetical protein